MVYYTWAWARVLVLSEELNHKFILLSSVPIGSTINPTAFSFDVQKGILKAGQLGHRQSCALSACIYSFSDGYTSRECPEFIIKAKENNNALVWFHSHLMHIVQPLDFR